MPPVVSLAGAFALGIGLAALMGSTVPAAALLPLLLLVPIALWPRAPIGIPLGLTVLGGWIAMSGAAHRAEHACVFQVLDGSAFDVSGWFVAREGSGGRSVPFHAAAGLPGGCAAEVRAVPPAGTGPVRPGEAGRWRAQWRRTPRPDPGRPGSAGTLFLGSPLGDSEVGVPVGVGRTSTGRSGTAERATSASPLTIRIRAATQRAIVRRFGSRSGIVDALILARRENIDPSVRDAFAAAGLAHLLAISGFHVAVLASLVFGTIRLCGAPRRMATVMSAIVVWLYIGIIGAPDAALRASVLLSVGALATLGRRRPHGAGVIGAAALLLLGVDPVGLSRIGFQLSFAGALGLSLYARPVAEYLQRRFPRPGLRPLWLAVGAGVAATIATSPLVAWHFGRVPVYGLPATLVAGPIVALALPGILAVLVLDSLIPSLSSFLAGGVSVFLDLLVLVAEGVAAAPAASPWIGRPTLVCAMAGGVVTAVLARHFRLRGGPRSLAWVPGLAAGILVAPMATSIVSGGALEIAVVDVGQGDAIALRSPRGRWMLVDAGPASPRWDAGARIVVPYLRQRGVRELDVFVLTHPDLDHIGGAVAVLQALPVRTVVDPGFAAARPAYVATLRAAGSAGAEWRRAPTLPTIEFDGVRITVLGRSGRFRSGAPVEPGAPVGSGNPGAGSVAPQPRDANDGSVVLMVEWGAFRALLTGDASAAVEEELLSELRPVQILKAGHHGSATSTSESFLAALAPELVLIPVGAGNSYGHPAPVVLNRLEAHGVSILRTDLDGTIEVRAHRDGSFDVRTELVGGR